MTRLYSAATAAGASRALVGFGAALLLAVLVSGCAGGAAPAPTPDPFAGLADRSDQAFRQGLEAYGQGQYRESLTLFESARTLSPTDDARIVQMIERSRAALAPTPTAVPPKPTEVPAVPTAMPVLMSTLAPDTELGRRYFGQVTLSMVPGRDSDAPAATQFFYQDQIGLHIEGLTQHLRLPFTIRVFDTDASRLVAEVQSEDNANAATKPVSLQADPKALTALTGLQAAAPTAVATAAARDNQLARFWDTYVWYHKGGEEPGRYRLELFANGILTNSFDYTVGTVPIASPEPALAPMVDPTPALPTADLEPPPAPVAQPTTRPSQSVSAPAPAPVRAAPAEPTPMPTATLVPTPQTAYTTVVGGVPAGLDVDWNSGRFYVADASGVIWSADAPTGQQRPTLGTPFNIGVRSPMDLAADPGTGNLLVSARGCSADPSARGCIQVLNGRNGAAVRSVSLPAAPGDLRVDSDLGLVYVALPELQALAEVDIRGGKVLKIIEGLPQITSLALDSQRHTLYAASLTGQLTVVDVSAGKVTGRISLTGAGLASVATARGLAYAVNTATHELAVVEPLSQSVIRYVLNQEPAAIAAAEDTGAIYVLSSRTDVILRIDPSDGSEIGRVVITDRTGHAAIRPNDVQGLRPRLVLNPADDTVFATVPESGSLAAVNEAAFPFYARDIPQPYIPDMAMANDIPEALWPAAVWGDSVLNAQGH
jgi:DNA-binding beta-propeller fold protein YncE